MVWHQSQPDKMKTMNLQVENDVIDSVSSVRDLGRLLDRGLSISKVSGVGYFHLNRLKTVRRILGMRTTASLVTAFVISRLDYCNSVLAGLPKSSIAPLQRVQNAAARLICALGPRDQRRCAWSRIRCKWCAIKDDYFTLV